MTSLMGANNGSGSVERAATMVPDRNETGIYANAKAALKNTTGGILNAFKSKVNRALTMGALAFGGGNALAEEAPLAAAPAASGAKIELVSNSATEKPALSVENPTVALADIMPAKAVKADADVVTEKPVVAKETPGIEPEATARPVYAAVETLIAMNELKATEGNRGENVLASPAPDLKPDGTKPAPAAAATGPSDSKEAPKPVEYVNFSNAIAKKDLSIPLSAVTFTDFPSRREYVPNASPEKKKALINAFEVKTGIKILDADGKIIPNWFIDISYSNFVSILEKTDVLRQAFAGPNTPNIYRYRRHLQRLKAGLPITGYREGDGYVYELGGRDKGLEGKELDASLKALREQAIKDGALTQAAVDTHENLYLKTLNSFRELSSGYVASPKTDCDNFVFLDVHLSCVSLKLAFGGSNADQFSASTPDGLSARGLALGADIAKLSRAIAEIVPGGDPKAMRMTQVVISKDWLKANGIDPEYNVFPVPSFDRPELITGLVNLGIYIPNDFVKGYRDAYKSIEEKAVGKQKEEIAKAPAPARQLMALAYQNLGEKNIPEDKKGRFQALTAIECVSKDLVELNSPDCKRLEDTGLKLASKLDAMLASANAATTAEGTKYSYDVAYRSALSWQRDNASARNLEVGRLLKIIAENEKSISADKQQISADKQQISAINAKIEADRKIIADNKELTRRLNEEAARLNAESARLSAMNNTIVALLKN